MRVLFDLINLFIFDEMHSNDYATSQLITLSTDIQFWYSNITIGIMIYEPKLLV